MVSNVIYNWGIKIHRIDNYKIISLSLDTPAEITYDGPDDSSFPSCDIFLWEETHVNIREWYSRIMQVPLIIDTSRNKFLFSNKVHKKRIEESSMQNQYISKKEFMVKFYDIS